LQKGTLRDTSGENRSRLWCYEGIDRLIGGASGDESVNHSEIVSFIWGVADLIRDTFKRGKYQDVILPLTVLRRLDCVLALTKAKVLET
jgi:hypothetical protein